jgi:kumamolisin
MSRAFDVELHRYETDEAAYRGRTGHVHVPAALANVVDAVLGLG